MSETPRPRIISGDPANPVYDNDGFCFIEQNIETGTSTWARFDGEGNIVVRTDTRVDGLLESNARQMADNLGQRWGEGRKVASLPMAFFYESGLSEAIAQEDDRFVSKVLNDADNAKFRTFGGRI